MRLLVAHQILIGAAIGLAVIFGARAAVHYSRAHATADLIVAAASVVVALALARYFISVRAKSLAERRAEGGPQRPL